MENDTFLNNEGAYFNILNSSGKMSIANSYYAIDYSKNSFDFSLTNIGNTKRFDVYNISANMESQNSYTLRGRMAVMKTTVNF